MALVKEVGRGCVFSQFLSYVMQFSEVQELLEGLLWEKQTLGKVHNFVIVIRSLAN